MVDTVYKNSVVSKACSKETFEFYLNDWSLFCGAMFMLMPLLGHYTIQKQGSKRDAIRPPSFSSFKVVLILLAKVVVI